MRAVIYANTGDASVLQVVERAAMEPAELEVRIRVVVSSVNPTDWKSRSGAFGSASRRFPTTTAPGIVDAVGSEVAGIGVVGPYPPVSPQAFEVRACFPKEGSTVEDPVTGSLNASLAEWLLRTGRATAPYTASQGTALGRSGRVHIWRDDGKIWVAGGTVTCSAGEVEL